MSRLMVPLFVLLLMVPFSPQPVTLGRDPADVTVVTEDGDIDGVGFARTTNQAYLRTSGAANFYRCYVEFDTSSIPDAAIVESLELHVKTYSSGTGTLDIREMVNRPSTTGNSQTVYNDIGDGDIYINYNFAAINTWYEVTLSAAAITDLTANLAADWFAVGFSPGTFPYFCSSESAGNEPHLEIQWHLAADYEFIVANPIYENNTDAGTVAVHVVGDGFEEDHNIAAGTTLYFPVMPTVFSWPVYSATRLVYTPEEENFTVTVPYDTIGVYSMTVKDKTATGGSTAAYLEAYRSIGGSELLVERMKIIFGNPTPLNMMVGSVYHIKVLFADGSEYDWGYFTATSTTSVNVIIRVVEFGDGAQMLYGTIHVGAERDEALITVDYLDDQNNTVWANVTIRERSGPVVLEVPYSNGSYTMNWASANTTLAYIVTVEGQHTDFGAWGRSWTFDPTYTFPAFPVLTGIFGSASSDLLPFLLVAVVTLMFGLKWQAKGLLAGCLVASFLSLFGAASWSYYWLAFAWFIAIMVNINVGGEG